MNSIQLLVLQGIPSSGKSTWAKEFLNKDNNSENWIRVCRDDIRRMFGKYWVESREQLVTDIETYTILRTLTEGKRNVIIDATNLNPKTIAKWEALVKERNSTFQSSGDLKQQPLIEIKYKYFHITPEEAIKRDALRGNESVGEKVITDFWTKYIKGKKDTESYIRQYIKQDVNLPWAIIVDIDGTVALINNRSPYDHTKVSNDLPNKPVINIVLDANELCYEIIFVSGRSDEGRKDTEAWIDKHIFPHLDMSEHVPYLLYMRKSKDWRKDSIIKQEIYEEYIKNKFCVKYVLDDRNQVVNYWRSEGLLCLQVYDGDF